MKIFRLGNKAKSNTQTDYDKLCQNQCELFYQIDPYSWISWIDSSNRNFCWWIYCKNIFNIFIIIIDHNIYIHTYSHIAQGKNIFITFKFYTSLVYTTIVNETFLYKNKYKAICHTVREDGRYIEAGENDNLIVQKLEANPTALGVFGFSFLDQNADKVQGAQIEAIEPTFESIADKSYPISRPLYFYVKKAHVGVVPGMMGYLKEFTNERAWGEDGYLAEKGMIPLPTKMRMDMASNTISLVPMTGKEALK